ncbi:MAG: hypothetical protein ABIO70_08830 [Pseudomonadota bacterium]
MSNPGLPALRRRGPLGRLVALIHEPPPPPPLALGFEASATRLVQWLDLLTRVSGVGVTPMHAVARALALGLARTPGANCVVQRGRLRHLPGVDLCLEVPGSDPDDPDARVTWRWLRPRADTASVPALCTEMQHGMAPVAAGDPLPPCSALLTTLDVAGLTVHHLPLPAGAVCSLTAVLHPVEQAPLAIHGAVVTRMMLRMGVAFDPRVFDLHSATALLREVRQILEEPRRLDTVDQFTGNLTRADTSTELELPDPGQGDGEDE